MFVTAGKTEASRYDNRAPIHIATAETSEHQPATLCGSTPVAPIRRGPAIEITCSRCLDSMALLGDPFDDARMVS